MGVQGLLPILKSVMDQVHVSKYAGKTVGVDASGWLYKGAYSCPVDLVLGRPTDAYLNYSLQQLKQLQAHKITPILVFDGAPVPAKAQENAARSRSRAEWTRKAKTLLQAQEEDQDTQAIYAACTRAVSVTNEMVMRLIAVLRRMKIQFYVAPYEADAQLAFLSKHKLVDLVFSDDSDCVPYGIKTVLFKLSSDGWGMELKRRSLGANEELSFMGWTDEMFLQLCVLAGCDYCPSIHGVGMITAYRLVSQYKTPPEVLKALQQKKSIPSDFPAHFYAAILTYRHQLVFDPRDAKLKMLSPLDISKGILPRVDTGLYFLGNVELRDDVVASIASGQIHPVTHESYAWKDLAATVLLKEQTEARPNRSRARSSTSSESSSMILSSRLQRDIGVVSTNMSEESPQGTSVASKKRSRVEQTLAVRYEKPRPSSRTSWTHLDSVLGSSDHIVNFRSPKVSENFKPLVSLLEPSLSDHIGNINAQALKEFEQRPVRGHMKRVKNPTNRRRDGKGSGFEGEVLCMVDQSQAPSLGGNTDFQLNPAAATVDSDRLTDGEDAPSKHTKRPRLFDRPSSSGSSLPSHVSDASTPMQLLRPTPFNCGPRPSSPPLYDVQLDWKLPPRLSQSTQSLRPALAKSTSSYRYSVALSAEEKWDRILANEIEDDSNSSSNDVDASHVSSPLASIATSRQPLAS